MAESDAYYRALALIPNFSKPTDECNILDYLHRIEQIGKNFGLTDSQKVDIVSLKSGSAIKDLVDTNSQTTTWKKLSKELIIFLPLSLILANSWPISHQYVKCQTKTSEILLLE